MTGILLLSRDNCYADQQGSVAWGPPEDKWWVRNMIYNKKVFIGKRTWRTIEAMSSLVDLPTTWQFVHPMDADIHFGGPKSFKAFPPDSFIIHRIHKDIRGLAFDMDWLNANYELVTIHERVLWQELHYAKK